MRREDTYLAILLAILGLAGAALLTALEKVLHLTPTIWNLLFLASILIIILSIANIALVIIFSRNPGRPKMGPALVINLGLCLIVIGFVYHYGFSLESQAPPTVEATPDVTIRFVYPDSPALVLVNQSAALARNIKWSVALWNMDDPRTYVNPTASPDAHDPLPIPVQIFDFLRPRTTGGPQNLFDSPLVAPHVKKGQRLFGSASVICPECARGHTYIVSIVWGEGGWYVEALNSTEGELLIPPNFKKETVAAYHRDILAQTPEAARIQIERK